MATYVHVCVGGDCPRKQEEGVGSLAARTTESYQSPDRRVRNTTPVLYKIKCSYLRSQLSSPLFTVFKNPRLGVLLYELFFQDVKAQKKKKNLTKLVS